MTGILPPEWVTAARVLLPRMEAAGWERVATAIGDGPWEQVWRRGPVGQRDKVLLEDVGNIIIRPWDGPEWVVPVLSPPQVAAVLELAGVLPATVTEKTIRQAIADPGAFLPRNRHRDYDDAWEYESIPAWGARAVMAVLAGGLPTAPRPPTVDRDAVAALVVESLWRAGWRPPVGVARVGDEPPPIWAELVAGQRNGAVEPAPAAETAPPAEPLPHRLPTQTGDEAGEDGWVDLPPERAMRALANWHNGGAEELDALHAEALAAQQPEAGEIEAGDAR